MGISCRETNTTIKRNQVQQMEIQRTIGVVMAIMGGKRTKLKAKNIFGALNDRINVFIASYYVLHVQDGVANIRRHPTPSRNEHSDGRGLVVGVVLDVEDELKPESSKSVEESTYFLTIVEEELTDGLNEHTYFQFKMGIEVRVSTGFVDIKCDTQGYSTSK
ncbi:hypothetical protein J1N35_040038 [Gossypium stocksii]|uniref:Uncharacterized protein n=1 Tax=Gossypium stocksii TaxID=47602 RepID=A0A9D3UCX5_9ROSI|nr:hypothetical protein J1N35_040038 [Gossypium stocksii]